jgi:transposase
MMRHRWKPVHLVVDGLPAHKTALVKTYVASTDGMLTLHLLPGYAPELNPDELVWSHMKRTGVARAPLRRGEKLRDRFAAQLAAVKRTPQLVRSQRRGRASRHCSNPPPSPIAGSALRNGRHLQS